MFELESLSLRLRAQVQLLTCLLSHSVSLTSCWDLINVTLVGRDSHNLCKSHATPLALSVVVIFSCPGRIFSYCVRARAYTHVLARVYSTCASTCTIHTCSCITFPDNWWFPWVVNVVMIMIMMMMISTKDMVNWQLLPAWLGDSWADQVRSHQVPPQELYT